jgi:subtilisin family serine protease
MDSQGVGLPQLAVLVLMILLPGLVISRRSASDDESHTIAAPGVCINSTWKGRSYNTISGTSMAAPHIAGTATLCIASGACSGLTPNQIIAKLRHDAATQPMSFGFTYFSNSLNDTTRYYGQLGYAGGY